MDPTPDPVAPSFHGSAAQQADPADRGFLRRGLYVQVVIWFTVLFVLGMTVLIWHRWSSVSLPTANIKPLGDESVEGAEATVTASDGTGEIGETKGSVKLEQKDGYAGTIWLVPGLYRLRVKLNGRVIQDQTINVPPMRSVVVLVSQKPGVGAATAPATAPAAPAPAPSADHSAPLPQAP